MINKPQTLQILIEKISGRTGMGKEKAIEALLAVSEHVKEEFPLLHSVVDLILGTEGLSGNKPFVTDFSKN